MDPKAYELYIKECVRNKIEPLNPYDWTASRNALTGAPAVAALSTNPNETVLAGQGADTHQTTEPDNAYDDPRAVPEYPAADTVTVRQWQRAWEYRIQLAQAFRALIK